MATVQSSRHTHHKPHSRRRSASDPFTDQSQSTPITSAKKAPPPPPKSHKHRTSTQTSPPKSAPVSRDNHRDISEAVRETVSVKNTSADTSNHRNKMGRSHTAVAPTRDASNRTVPTGRRSHSQDSVLAAAAAVEKAKATGKHRSKKGSQHADIIDRLDYTGVGLFHHDGPFDACAPSRNRYRNKAPMLAWSARSEEMPREFTDTSNSPYPSPAAAHDASSPPASYYQEAPKKKVDAIAEAWGIHEPEPYEEFFAGGGRTDTPASSIYNGRESRPKRGKDTREDRSRVADRRSVLPPPQPILVPDATDTDTPPSSPPATAAVKRSKSLMQRIRKMRDAPNIPVDHPDGGVTPPSPSSPTTESYPGARPYHRPQNSFLGRFGGKTHHQQLPSSSEQPEPYILINNANDIPPTQNKELPSPPAATGETPGYFDGAGNPQSPASPGLGRKISLMKKVRGVVRGTKRE